MSDEKTLKDQLAELWDEYDAMLSARHVDRARIRDAIEKAAHLRWEEKIYENWEARSKRGRHHES